MKTIYIIGDYDPEIESKIKEIGLDIVFLPDIGSVVEHYRRELIGKSRDFVVIGEAGYGRTHAVKPFDNPPIVINSLIDIPELKPLETKKSKKRYNRNKYPRR